MTHTLHRMGSNDSLKNDFVLLAMPAKNTNEKGSAKKLNRLLEMAVEHGAIKIGNASKGNETMQGGKEKVVKNVSDGNCVHAVFDDPALLTNMLKDLKEEDLGISVVVSGLFEHVGKCCNEAGLRPHTINQSLGRWGKTERLPSDDVLELNTMCGHGMVSVGLINDVATQIKDGRSTPEEAAETLFAPCVCGIFNTKRAASLLRAMVSK
ncbi:hypothetical protein DSCW_05620 [Desulfosarcina widdelii]|uniref:Uncharacterized protein n=1 Tax=Desulfosarcina widdelii TaxID=947919 RepID=A0A5K7YXL3_9BACT|nr:hypothetical protein [Desulfosarcina widdelii]BBO73145.1 hypothetical protein DSCW_05620 [Desulfosarcina widdelii]